MKPYGCYVTCYAGSMKWASANSVALTLEGLAAAMRLDSNSRRTAARRGRTITRRSGASVPPEGQKRRDKTVSTLQEVLGSRFGDELARGHALSIEEAVAMALNENAAYPLRRRTTPMLTLTLCWQGSNKPMRQLVMPDQLFQTSGESILTHQQSRRLLHVNSPH